MNIETCYRHPGRETGVSCSSCERPICPDCMTTTSVGMRCPECAGEKTRARTMASTAPAPALTYLLMGICILVQVGSVASGSSASGSSFGGSQLISDGAVSRPAIADGELWRLITAGFLHAGLAHLLFNTFALYALGTMLEPAIGRLRFFVIYFVSLLAGSFGALMAEPDALTVGASGAIFGLMGAALVFMRSRGINPMESGLGLWLGLNLLITFTIPGISIGGHIGGLAGGMLAAFVIYEVGERLRASTAIQLLLASAIGAAAIVGSVAVSTG